MFAAIKGQIRNATPEELVFLVRNHFAVLQQPFVFTNEAREIVKRDISLLLDRWKKAHHMEHRFFKKSASWLDSDTEISVKTINLKK